MDEKKFAVMLTDTQEIKTLECDPQDEDAIAAQLKRLFGSCGDNPWTGPGFNCDYGLNIHVGDRFLAIP